MFIRRTKTGNSSTGERYDSHRLVESKRSGNKVRQSTLMNLGRHFTIHQKEWAALCTRIDELLHGVQPLFPMTLSPEAENEAQRIVAHLVATRANTTNDPETSVNAEQDWQTVDVNSFEQIRPRSVGIEQIALWAMDQIGLESVLAEAGLNAVQRAAAKALIIGRMAKPGSELATHHWLTKQTGLGELIDVDFDVMGLAQLYRTSDRLWANEQLIQERLFTQIRDLFGFTTTVTLYDLTNTYMEGAATANPDAKRGHSKEKRSDCPLVTLGMVLDGSGFVRRAKIFPGNAVECRTLQTMLDGLDAPNDALVVMDRGIATAENIAWLKETGRKYLVANREQQRRSIDPDNAESLLNGCGQRIELERIIDESGEELRLWCRSETRAAKETAIETRKADAFEAAMTALVDSLSQPGTPTDLESVCRRAGQIKRRHSQAARHYKITVDWYSDRNQVQTVRWEDRALQGSRKANPGVYCLRTNLVDWDSEQLWRTYTMLTDLESVFRSLKSELGLRPIYHHVQRRVSGHLFITVLAYQVVQVIRRQLAAKGIHDSWDSLRKQLQTQVRVTGRFLRKDGRTLHVRRATTAEPAQQQIYAALGIDPSPGGVKKTVI
jgi:transposase